MPALSALKAITRPVEVDFHGVAIRIDYRPAALTVETESEIFDDRRSDGEDTAARILGAFARVIADWDITDGKAKLPITVESLRTVPREILFEALKKISEDQTRGKNGAGGSSTH